MNKMFSQLVSRTLYSQAQVVHLLLVQGGGTSGVVVTPGRSVNTSSYDYLT